jgi:hypothetical protein
MDTTFGLWWGSMGAALRIFHVIGVASAAVLLIQFVLLLFGFDGDGDADLTEASDASLLSMRSITAFFVGFGWTGVAMMRGGSSVPVATVAALVVGSGFMFAVFGLMKVLYSMRSSGTIDYHNAIGEVGQVYVTIGPAMAKAGQVEVMIQGRLCTVTAMTRASHTLDARTRVKVVGLVDGTTLLVEPVE